MSDADYMKFAAPQSLGIRTKGNPFVKLSASNAQSLGGGNRTLYPDTAYNEPSSLTPSVGHIKRPAVWQGGGVTDCGSVTRGVSGECG